MKHISTCKIAGWTFSAKLLKYSPNVSHMYFWGITDGAVVRVLATHFCALGSIPEPGVTCELSMSLVLVLASRVFLQVLRFYSLLKNQHFKFQFNLNGNGGL